VNHGDLRLKNVLVNEKRLITAIPDWVTCTSNLAPEWELSAALHDLPIDEKEAFLEGYGLSGKEVSAAAPAVKASNIKNYLAIEEHAKTGEAASATVPAQRSFGPLLPVTSGGAIIVHQGPKLLKSLQ
jgi:hypothetical protein